MFFDLNVPLPPSVNDASSQNQNQPSKKQKQKQKQQGPVAQPTISAHERQQLETRIDTLVHLGYTVIALNQIIQGRFDSAIHQWPELGLRERPGVLILKRLTIVIDEGNEKGGTGLISSNTTGLSQYDIISICPTTATSFSHACLTDSIPGPLSSHIITLDLSSQPRLPFHLKHTLVRTALRNGAVFEINYSSAVNASGDEFKRRNWWANSREVTRVTKGKCVMLSSGGLGMSELRAPRDVMNLVSLLGLDQEATRDTVFTTPKSLILRAQTRKTYRAVLSEPKLIMPESPAINEDTKAEPATQSAPMDIVALLESAKRPSDIDVDHSTPERKAKKRKKGSLA